MEEYIETVEKINELHDIIQFYEGKRIVKGCRSGQIKNPYWHVMNRETNEEYFIMLCNEGILTYISIESIEDVVNFRSAWTYNKYIGYVFSEKTYLHAFIMNHSGHGKGGDSVDHMNRKKLDNRITNLKVLSCGKNTSNQQKKSRSREACALPVELGDRKLPKYTQYCRENISVPTLKKMKEYKHLSDEELRNLKLMKRNFFIVVNNPYQTPDEEGIRYWCSTKSMSVSIVDKYNSMIHYLESIGYQYELDWIDEKELHKEFFLDIENDFMEKKKKPTKKMKEEMKDDEPEKSRIIHLDNDKIIELIQWKNKVIKKEKNDDGSTITREYISKYYKDRENLDITPNQIHRYWNTIIMKEDEFIEDLYDINYDEYVKIVETPLRRKILK